MAKGQKRSGREPKKPKADKNKKKKGGPAYTAGQVKADQNPFAKKGS